MNVSTSLFLKVGNYKSTIRYTLLSRQMYLKKGVGP